MILHCIMSTKGFCMTYYINPDRATTLDQKIRSLKNQGLDDYQAPAVALQMQQAAIRFKKFEASRPKSSLTPQQYAELKVLLNL